MDRQKRPREGDEFLLEEKTKKKNNGKKPEMSDRFLEDSDIFNISDTYRPLGVFEFPWQKEEGLKSESDGWDLRHLFFSSLVDGCSAAIGFPGDRLSQTPAPIDLAGESSDDGSWPLEEEIDGADCIWSCVLSQPLSAVSRKASNA